MAGRAVSNVVLRCEEAKENEKLDLSSCKLVSIPDAIFLLLKNTNIQTCNLSDNILKRIPAKICTKFIELTDLNLSKNKLVSLPDEMSGLLSLQSLDLSHNSFAEIPQVIYKLETIKTVNAQNNIITVVEVDRLEALKHLQQLNLEENPLPAHTHAQLSHMTSFSVSLSPVQDSDPNYQDLD